MNVRISLVIMDFAGILMEDIPALVSKDGPGFTVILVYQYITFIYIAQFLSFCVSFSRQIKSLALNFIQYTIVNLNHV